jgi:hypothetical protein
MSKESSRLYRLMIYFAVATFLFYEKSIAIHRKMTVYEFREKNKSATKRVFDEGLSIMNYELSWSQVNTAILAYMQAKFYPKSTRSKKFTHND